MVSERLELSYKKLRSCSHLIQAVFILQLNYQNYSSVNLHLNYVQRKYPETDTTEQSTRAAISSVLSSQPSGQQRPLEISSSICLGPSPWIG